MIATAFQSTAGDGAAPDRLARDGRPRRGPVGRHPLHEPRRHELPVGRSGDARRDHRRRRAARAVPARRVARRRADPAARALPQRDVPDDERDRLRRRVRALRLGHVRAALPAGRQGPQPDRVGAADDADDARPARHRNRERPADLALRALPPVPDHGHGRRHGRRSTSSAGSRFRRRPGSRPCTC